MDGLSAAASVIAVIQIAGQTVGLCQIYYTAVKSSRQDIKRLQDEVVALDGTLSRLADLDDDTNPEKFAALHGLNKHFQDCHEDLRSLLASLQAHDGMSKFGLRSLKWPLKRKDVDDAIKTIERFKATFTLAITVDLVSKVELTQKKILDLNEQAEVDRARNAALQEKESREKVFTWLADPNPSMNYNNAFRRREVATGNWFFNGNVFLNWTQQKTSLLWLIEDIANCRLNNGAIVQDGDALAAATWRNQHKIVNLLIEKGAEVDGDGIALEGAACNGTAETVGLLIENGANIHARTFQFGSALIAASVARKLDIVQLLLDCGADPNVKNPVTSTFVQAAKMYGESALQVASNGGSVQVVQCLLEHGAYPNQPGPIKGNPLSAGARSTQITQLLLHYGADPNAEDKVFGTSLRAAPATGNTEVVSLLLDAGAEIDHQSVWFPTALHRAVAANKLAVAELLIENGADFSTNHTKYGTPLQKAVRGGFDDMQELLQAHGAIL